MSVKLHIKQMENLCLRIKEGENNPPRVMLKVYFFTATQIAQISQPMLLKWSGQLRQYGQK